MANYSVVTKFLLIQMKNFKSISYVHLLVVSAVVSLCASMPVRLHGANASGEPWATYEAAEGVFPIVTNDIVTGIYYDINENIAVRKAIKSLRDDICKVTGATPQLAVDSELPRFPIIIGTVGQSRVIDSLVEKGVIEADSLWKMGIVCREGGEVSAPGRGAGAGDSRKRPPRHCFRHI